jgi:uncharacterized repeat protein (TIGR01451 family)
VAAFASLTVFAAPGDVLFSDSFEDGSLAPWTRTNGGRANVSNAPGFAGTGSFGAFTRWDTVTVTSPSIGAAVPDARLDIWVRRGADSFSENPDAGEDLVLQYRRSNGTWVTLQTWLGSGTPGQVYNASFGLPPDALHGTLAVRLTQTNGSGNDFDYWHFDDVVVTESGGAPALAIGECEEFEAGLSTNWSVTQTSGIAGTSNATSQSPDNSMFLANGVVDVTSSVIDTSDPAFGDLSLWVRRGSDTFSEDPDAGEDLVVEYLDNVGTWVALETFTGAGTAGQIFIRSYDLPAAGRHAGFRLRFRQTGGSGDSWDFWHVDDVCFELSTEPVLQVTKITMPQSDPINGATGARAIPGAIMQYTISVTNQGLGATDANSLSITDVVPANMALYVSTDLGDPIVFNDGSPASGLSYTYATDVAYSNQVGGGPPYDYTPSWDGQGFDPAVTGFQVSPGGALNAASPGGNPNFSTVLRMRIE